LFFPLGIITLPQLTKLAMFSVLVDKPFWMIIYIVLAAAGIYTQIVTTRTFELKVEDPKF
jgi:hypothetical protein